MHSTLRFIAAASLSVLVGGGSVACGEGATASNKPGNGAASNNGGATSSNTGAATAPAKGVDTKDWPQFRGPTGMGTSGEKTVTEWSQSKNIVWKVEMPGPGTSSPIVHGDRIYITCYTGYNVPGNKGSEENLKRHLMALKRTDGTEIWSTPTDPKLPEQAKIRDEHYYASSTPAADETGIYVFYGKTGVLKFDHKGKQVWQTDVGSKLHEWGSAASPLLYGDLVIINASVESESLIALDKKTGDEKWRLRGIKESWNTPILVDVKGAKDGVTTELVLAMAGKVLGVNPKTGEQLWSSKTDIGWYMVPSLVAADGVVYAIGGRSGIAGLAVRLGGRGEVTSTHRIWTSNFGSNVSSPIVHDGHLYWMNDNSGVAFCCKLDSGEVVYKERVTGRWDQCYGSPVMSDGKIYYTSRSGKTLVVPAKPTYEQLAFNDLSDRGMFNGSPAVVDGRILLRSDKFLYCIGEK